MFILPGCSCTHDGFTYSSNHASFIRVCDMPWQKRLCFCMRKMGCSSRHCCCMRRVQLAPPVPHVKRTSTCTLVLAPVYAAYPLRSLHPPYLPPPAVATTPASSLNSSSRQQAAPAVMPALPSMTPVPLRSQASLQRHAWHLALQVLLLFSD